MFDKKEIKNFKKDFVANTVIIYFSDSELGNFEGMHKSIRANTKFLKIGIDNLKVNSKNEEKNKFESNFLSWESHDSKNKIIPAPNFFQNNIQEIKKIVQDADLAILLYKSDNIHMLSYIREFAYVLNKFDVFSFHCIVENFVSGKKELKIYKRLLSDALKYSQPFIPISEATIIDAYEDANIVNRKQFIAKFVSNLIESIVVPFVEPNLNPHHFSLIKSLFYSDSKNFLNKIVPTIGISNSKVDWLDISIIQALSSPIFYGSFNAAKTFIVTIKTPYLTNKMTHRIEHILKSIIGDDKKFVICKYIGEFDVDLYSQVTILALNVNESKLILDPKDIEEHIKNLLNEVQKSKKLFSDESTKTILMDIPRKKLTK